jgi:hypothetical protein
LLLVAFQISNTKREQPDNLFDSKGTVTPRAEYAVSKALEYKPSARCIIVTNFEDIAVFHPQARNRPEPGFERISTTRPPLALRVISTAYLHSALGLWDYINTPDPHMEVDETLILLEGPPQDPNQSLLPDERIFATYHRHSDFDIETLVRDCARALQFFRWQEEVQRRYSKVVAHPNDTLTALTNEVGQIIPDFHPLYPYDASEIPSDTADHLPSIQRESPLVTADLGESLKRSKTFALKIQSILAEGSPRGICTVYRCQITSIDKTPVSSPSLSVSNYSTTDSNFCDVPTKTTSSSMKLYLGGSIYSRLLRCMLLTKHSLMKSFDQYKGLLFPGSMVHTRSETTFLTLKGVFLTGFDSLLFPMEQCCMVS